MSKSAACPVRGLRPSAPSTRFARSSASFARALVVERLAGVAAELLHGLAQRRQGLGRDVEAQHVTPGFVERRSRRTIAWPASAHQPLDLAYRAPLGRRDPVALGGGRGDARELAHRRPRQRARGERTVELRQLFERRRDAELVLGGARPVAEHAFDVLGERRETEPRVHAGPLGPEQPLPLLAIERCALGCNA